MQITIYIECECDVTVTDHGPERLYESDGSPSAPNGGIEVELGACRVVGGPMDGCLVDRMCLADAIDWESVERGAIETYDGDEPERERDASDDLYDREAAHV